MQRRKERFIFIFGLRYSQQHRFSSDTLRLNHEKRHDSRHSKHSWAVAVRKQFHACSSLLWHIHTESVSKAGLVLFFIMKTGDYYCFSPHCYLLWRFQDCGSVMVPQFHDMIRIHNIVAVATLYSTFLTQHWNRNVIILHSYHSSQIRLFRTCRLIDRKESCHSTHVLIHSLIHYH